MTIKRMDHVGVVVEDLAAAIAFFVDLGLEPVGEGTVGGETVDRLIGLEGVRSDVAFLRTPDGRSQIELSTFRSPAAVVTEPKAPMNAVGLRHLSFAVEGIEDILARLRSHGAELIGELAQYEDSYRLCYLRGPEGIIVELAEQIG